MQPPHIMISAGEASGDMHGANVVQALKELVPGVTFSGMGGKELEAAGVKVLFDAAKIAVVGIVEVISHLKDIINARRALVEEMQRIRPALLILIDFPDFNLLLAAKAKKLGIPVFYYISPQIWAWRSSRMQKIGRLSKRVATILPFEPGYYAKHGYQVDFVGHPLLDTVTPSLSRREFLAHYDIPTDNHLIGIIPGSRTREIKNLLADFLAAAELIKAKSGRPCTFLLPKASTISTELLNQHGLSQAAQRIDIRLISSNRYSLMAACNGAIAASGTVTLELAIVETPTVVAYKLAPITYCLGRLLVRNLRFFSLVNLIADREIIPELLQDEVTPQRLADELMDLLEKEQHDQSITKAFSALKATLGGPGASKRAAAIALEIINEGK
ncbi:MAG: lipid-A-disaccharide synthase [Desulfobulbus propionicus]|nr:MAG: lipid-A-disaccharide synthase [Desulfobulbus propionicus]